MKKYAILTLAALSVFANQSRGVDGPLVPYWVEDGERNSADALGEITTRLAEIENVIFTVEEASEEEKRFLRDKMPLKMGTDQAKEVRLLRIGGDLEEIINQPLYVCIGRGLSPRLLTGGRYGEVLDPSRGLVEAYKTQDEYAVKGYRILEALPYAAEQFVGRGRTWIKPLMDEGDQTQDWPVVNYVEFLSLAKAKSVSIEGARLKYDPYGARFVEVKLNPETYTVRADLLARYDPKAVQLSDQIKAEKKSTSHNFEPWELIK